MHHVKSSWKYELENVNVSENDIFGNTPPTSMSNLLRNKIHIHRSNSEKELFIYQIPYLDICLVFAKGMCWDSNDKFQFPFSTMFLISSNSIPPENWPLSFRDMNGLYGIAAIRSELFGSLVSRMRFAAEKLAKNTSEIIIVNWRVEIMVQSGGRKNFINTNVEWSFFPVRNTSKWQRTLNWTVLSFSDVGPNFHWIYPNSTFNASDF